MDGSAYLALTAAFVWGILSILLSPCHLSSIPLIIGFISEQKDHSTRKAFVLSFLFGLGILITIALIGVLTALMGRMIGDVGRYGNYAVACIFFIVGLHLAGVIPLNFAGVGNIGMKQKGCWAAFILGLVFGIALGPCTFAYMAPVLTLSLRVAATNAAYAVLLLTLYGLGHCLVIVAAGTSTEAVQRYLNWNERSKGAAILKRVCGVLVIFGGIYLIYNAH